MGNEHEINSSNTERIVRLETLVESQTSFLTRIESKLDLLSEKYITKELFNEITGGIQKQINDIKEEKKSNRQIFPAWISNIIAIGAIIFAVIYK